MPIRRAGKQLEVKSDVRLPHNLLVCNKFFTSSRTVRRLLILAALHAIHLHKLFYNLSVPWLSAQSSSFPPRSAAVDSRGAERQRR